MNETKPYSPTRSLIGETHEESHPESKTKHFLKEQYGEGKGVRKGTYLKGIPTEQGNMYVTEIR